MKAIVSPLYFIYLFVLSLFIGFSIGSCSDNEFEELSDNSNATKVQTRARLLYLIGKMQTGCLLLQCSLESLPHGPDKEVWLERMELI